MWRRKIVSHWASFEQELNFLVDSRWLHYQFYKKKKFTEKIFLLNILLPNIVIPVNLLTQES